MYSCCVFLCKLLNHTGCSRSCQGRCPVVCRRSSVAGTARRVPGVGPSLRPRWGPGRHLPSGARLCVASGCSVLAGGEDGLCFRVLVFRCLGPEPAPALVTWTGPCPPSASTGRLLEGRHACLGRAAGWGGGGPHLHSCVATLSPHCPGMSFWRRPSGCFFHKYLWKYFVSSNTKYFDILSRSRNSFDLPFQVYCP